jgi:hypothetical protein
MNIQLDAAIRHPSGAFIAQNFTTVSQPLSQEASLSGFHRQTERQRNRYTEITIDRDRKTSRWRAREVQRQRGAEA